MAFTENIDIVNISNLTRITDLSVDDLVIINDTSTDETKVVELEPLSQFFNKQLTLNGLGDLALGGAVGKELKSGDGLVWNGNYWVNEPIVFEAPEDGNPYLRKDGAWVLSKDEGVQSIQALAGLENIGDEADVKLQVDQNWFDSKYASRGDSVSFGDIVVENSVSLDEKGRLEYDGAGRFTYYPLDISDFYTAETLPPETDPIFSASAASSIRFQDIINWNTAHSWGDHSQAGYLAADAANLNSLNDVFISSPKDGHIIKYSADSGSWYNGNPSPGKLNDLEDVQAAGSQDKWALLYQAGAQIWASEPLLLEKLTDVEVTGVAPGDYLGWDGDNWVNVSQDDVNLDIIGGLGINVVSLGPTSYLVALDAVLNDLTNCVVAGAQQGDYLRYYNGVWLPADGPTPPVIPTVNNPRITLKAGTNMTGGGSFTLNQGNAHTITFNANVEIPDGAFYKIKTSQSGTQDVKINLDSTVKNDDSSIVIKPGAGINFSDIGSGSFRINANSIEIDDGAFYKIKTTKTSRNVRLKLDSTLNNDDSSVLIKPGKNIDFSDVDDETFTINANVSIPDGAPVASYDIDVTEGGGGNIKLRLNSSLGDDSEIAFVPGDGITFSDVVDNKRFKISAIPGEATVPNLQQVLDKGNDADRNIELKRNVGTPQETGCLLSSRGYIELTDENTGKPHIQFRNAIGGNDDYDWELRQDAAKFQIRYDFNNDASMNATVVEIGKGDVKFGDAKKSDGVRIQYRGRIEITDETSGTPEIEFRNAVGGNDNFDWRIQQRGRTLNIDHDKDNGNHAIVQLKGTNSNDPGLIVLGESRNRDGMDVLLYGNLYDDDSYAHPILGAKIWGTVSNKGNKGQIKKGSKRKNGNYNFSAHDAGHGRVKINFSPTLPDNDYCILVSGYDTEGDHMFGTYKKEKDSATLYSKDLENYNDSASGDFQSKDNSDEIMFAIFFL